MTAPIPQGIEVLVKKASVDADFRELLLTSRAEAAGQIGLALTATESLMLAAVPRGQLEAIIAQVTVPQEHRRAFLGKAAAAMLAALGVAAVNAVAGGPTRGTRPDQIGSAGVQPDRPNAPPADEAPEKKDPAEKPAKEKDKQDELEKQVIEIVAQQLRVKEPKEITNGKLLVSDLGAGTSSLVRLRKALEKKFKIKLPGDKFKKVRSVGDVVSTVRGAVKEKTAQGNPQPTTPQPTNPQPPPFPGACGGVRPR